MLLSWEGLTEGDLIKEFKEIKLYSSVEMRNASAERGKEQYGGVKEWDLLRAVVQRQT